MIEPGAAQPSLTAAAMSAPLWRICPLDDAFPTRVAKARDEGKVLRYVRNVEEDGVCRVKIAEVMATIRCTR
ncbi:hypothetical protein ACNKHS_00035 [Shigella flexneri]